MHIPGAVKVVEPAVQVKTSKYLYRKATFNADSVAAHGSGTRQFAGLNNKSLGTLSTPIDSNMAVVERHDYPPNFWVGGTRTLLRAIDGNQEMWIGKSFDGINVDLQMLNPDYRSEDK